MLEEKYTGKGNVLLLAGGGKIYTDLAARFVRSERELEDILTQGAAVADCIRRGADRTQADRAFHAAIVRAAHNEFMMRLLPMIDRAVETAISAGEHKEALAQITLQDHALLLEFIQKRDGEGAEHAMAIHMRHAVEELGVEGL